MVFGRLIRYILKLTNVVKLTRKSNLQTAYDFRAVIYVGWRLTCDRQFPLARLHRARTSYELKSLVSETWSFSRCRPFRPPFLEYVPHLSSTCAATCFVCQVSRDTALFDWHCLTSKARSRAQSMRVRVTEKVSEMLWLMQVVPTSAREVFGHSRSRSYWF